MANNSKQLNSPLATGNAGGHFEARVQASYVVLMLTGGYAPCLPCWPIVEIKLQGRVDGYDTDDLIVTVEEGQTGRQRKLLGQVKRSIAITQGDRELPDVMQAAWNDYSRDCFQAGNDQIALITGPMSATDSEAMEFILGQARSTKSAEQFFRYIGQANFSPSKADEKLDALRYHLNHAKGSPLSNEEIYAFLQRFHMIGYDLGTEVGVVLPLLHSHISQVNRQHPHLLWSRIIEVVENRNQGSGTITIDNLPEDLRDEFTKPVPIPARLAVIPPEETVEDWNRHPQAATLVKMNLIGVWSEKAGGDAEAVQRIAGEQYDSFIAKAREALQIPDAPFRLRDGLWKATQRERLWDELGPRVMDRDVDALKEAAVRVLTERDPALELPKEDRHMANLEGKVLAYSPALRESLADGLALLSNRAGALTHCSERKAETAAILAVREIFEGADWMLWASLDDLLPVLAEAAPKEFLTAVAETLQSNPNPFDELFSQEGSGIFGRNYMSGLLWALETLAWQPEHLVQVCSILGVLARADRGGQWANRPANSLLKILLPWHPQTLAPAVKRVVAVRTLCIEQPEIAWKLMIDLLPNQHQVSSGSHKPRWRLSAGEMEQLKVTNKEYWVQALAYADLAISAAGLDTSRLRELAGHLDRLPMAARERLLEVLSSREISERPEDERSPLWEVLTGFVLRHRRFSTAEWAWSEELLQPIEELANRLAPAAPLERHRRLFSTRVFDLYEENGNWQEQERKLDASRQQAMAEILAFGRDAVVQFLATVDDPRAAGFSLGKIAGEQTDSYFLPDWLTDPEQNHSSFLGGYSLGRYLANGYLWADRLCQEGWSSEQIASLLAMLPFQQETWHRAFQWLGGKEGLYWQMVRFNPFQAEGNFLYAIDKLLEYGRPNAAIDCIAALNHLHQSLPVDRSLAALLAAVDSGEPRYSMDTYHIQELIQALQQTPGIDKQALLHVEWAYLPLLDGEHAPSPITLEYRLASDPAFFCEVLRLMYRSKKNEISTGELSNEAKAMAKNAWQLLNQWHVLPGTGEDGRFDPDRFTGWLDHVKRMCEESGHLEVAMSTIGGVLIHSPADPCGLWIDETVAAALNAEEAEDMRRGFSIGVYNSRGVHSVDPTGEPELELASKYRQRADDVENGGYWRFAVTLRGLSHEYQEEAGKIIAEQMREIVD